SFLKDVQKAKRVGWILKIFLEEAAAVVMGDEPAPQTEMMVEAVAETAPLETRLEETFPGVENRSFLLRRQESGVVERRLVQKCAIHSVPSHQLGQIRFLGRGLFGPSPGPF